MAIQVMHIFRSTVPFLLCLIQSGQADIRGQQGNIYGTFGGNGGKTLAIRDLLASN